MAKVLRVVRSRAALSLVLTAGSAAPPAEAANGLAGGGYATRRGAPAVLGGGSCVLGLQAEVVPALTLALVWSPRVELPLRHVRMTVHFSAIGLGKVRHATLELAGLALPPPWTLGAAWRPAPSTELSLGFSHPGWARAMSVLKTEASAPGSAAAPAVLSARRTLRAHDRVLLAAQARNRFVALHTMLRRHW